MTNEKIDVQLVLGSETDAPHGNTMIEIFKAVGVKYKVSYASCHRDAGDDLLEFLASIGAPIIAYLGGMEFAAPGVAESINRNVGHLGQLVFAIPTDKAARSAIENLPMGVGIATSGLNEISLRHSLVNSALTIAKLAAMLGNQNVLAHLARWYIDFRKSKPLVVNVALTEKGFIPIKEKK